jgi:aryl-alcohol dehydrogenase-like predicted oxidoreductase
MERVLDPRDYGTLGLGCWAIGGPWTSAVGDPLGWGVVDDDESAAAIKRALELGVRVFDTADTYGTGHSERVLGQALGDRRGDVLLVSKFGNTFDEASRARIGVDCSPAYIRSACEASLRRLGTDYLDVYLLHLGDIQDEELPGVRDTLEGLVAAGRIRAYGWSTDQVHRVRTFGESPNCAAVEIGLNVLDDSPEMIPVLAELELPALVRSPLAMGLLAGRITRGSRMAHDDVRAIAPKWLGWFEGGRPTPAFMDRLDAVHEILAEDDRSMVEGALGWLWARSPWLLPIPGFRTSRQVEQSFGAAARGPLSAAQMDRIATRLGRQDSQPIPGETEVN